MYCLHALGALSDDVLQRQLVDVHPQVRIHALKIVESASAGGAKIVQQLRNMLTDDNEGVRYQLALTAGMLPPMDRIKLLSTLAVDSTADKMRFALLSSMG